MNLGEAKVRAIQLINEYSNNGQLISPSSGNYQDYALRMPGLANDAQMEIARYIKISAVYSISQPQIPNLLGIHNGWDIDLYLPDQGDKVYSAVGAKSFYVEVDRPCTILLKEGANILKQIDVSGITKFTAYKGNITPSSSTATVTMTITGNYPVQIKNRALFAYSFPTDDDVPTYQPYVPYDMPEDYMGFEKVMRAYDQRQLMEWNDYKQLKNGKTIAINWFLNGQFDIYYFKRPTAITDSTPDTYEFEIDEEAQVLIPYYMGGHVIMSERQDIGVALINEYNKRLANLSAELASPNAERIYTVYTMG